MILVNASQFQKKKKNPKKEEILVDDVEYLLLVMWDKNLCCVYVVNDFYLFYLNDVIYNIPSGLCDNIYFPIQYPGHSFYLSFNLDSINIE